MKKISILYLILIFTFSFSSFVSADVRAFDLFSNQTLQTTNPIQTYTSAVLMEITTQIPATCRYSGSSTLSYESMEGTFDYNFETSHKKTIDGLSEGLYKYYVKCMMTNGTIPAAQLEITVKSEKLISAQINLEKDSPLNAGQYDLTLVTSKIPSQKPTLTYSVDGITYNSVPLSGENSVWRGYIVIPQSAGETVGSFKFSGKDLEGRSGDAITKNAVFVIDTKKPSTIGTIDIKGYTGQIKLEWYNDEDVEEYQIFRSLESQVDYTNYFKTTNEKYFIDNDVEKGKTYYYRVAPVDSAGNIADLSKIISSTALLDNTTAASTGLRLELRSGVDNLLTTINTLSNNIEEIKSSLGNKEQKEKEIMEVLQITKEITNTQNELTYLKKEVEAYKTQDLSKEELTRKIDSSTLKAELIKKKVPESITIIEEKNIVRVLDENSLNSLILDYSSEYTESDISKIIKNSLKLLKEEEIAIVSNGYNLEIGYLDGTRKQQTLIEEKIDSRLERSQNIAILLNVPVDIAEGSSDISIKNTGYKVIKESSILLKFDADTKKISYTLNKKVDLKYLSDEIISPVVFEQDQNNIITGNAIYSNLSFQEIPYKIIIPVLVTFLLLILIVILKSKKRKINRMFSEIEEDIKNGKITEAKEKYIKIKENYSKFSKKEKMLAYNKFLEVQKKIGGI